MYPYNFEYERATRVADAADSAKRGALFLAGGQSLVQAMKVRLAAPDEIVDLGGVESLVGVTVGPQSVSIGAMTTHAEVACSSAVTRLIPALADLASGIGDPQVRNMGTIGGSIAHADPAACYPSAILALGATVHTDSRAIPGERFFTGLYETALEHGELITSVQFPAPLRAAYVKYKQPASRFALVGVFVALRDDGVRVAVTGAKSHVYRETALEAALSRSFTPDAARAVNLPSDGMNSDIHGSAEYRASMISVMAARAVAAALAR